MRNKQNKRGMCVCFGSSVLAVGVHFLDKTCTFLILTTHWSLKKVLVVVSLCYRLACGDDWSALNLLGNRRDEFKAVISLFLDN